MRWFVMIHFFIYFAICTFLFFSQFFSSTSYTYIFLGVTIGGILLIAAAAGGGYFIWKKRATVRREIEMDTRQ